jgi:hypothetical protein
VDEHLGHLSPAEVGIGPVDRGYQEHRPETLAREPHVLEPCVDERHVTGVLQVLLGNADQVVTGFQGRHAQPASEEAARPLAGPAAHLGHPVAVADRRQPACAIDERVRVGRAVTVVLRRDLVEDRAMGSCEPPLSHAAQRRCRPRMRAAPHGGHAAGVEIATLVDTGHTGAEPPPVARG